MPVRAEIDGPVTTVGPRPGMRSILRLPMRWWPHLKISIRIRRPVWPYFTVSTAISVPGGTGTGKGVAGATRFVSGLGRHGDFSKI